MPPKSDKPAMKELLVDEQAHGIELVLTPVVFGGIGWLLDRWLGTTPWLAVALAAFSLLATVLKLWFGYDARMRELESASPWARRDGTPSQPAEPAADADLWAERKAPR